jgi:hypothetical protein
MPDLVIEIGSLRTEGNEDDLLDSGRVVHVTWHLQHTSHRKPLGDSPVGKSDQCSLVVRQDNPVIRCRPFQQRFIRSRHQADILHPNDVNQGLMHSHAARDRAAEVFVRD